MKIFGKTFLFLGIFILPVGVVYGFMTHFTEWAGFPALIVTALMCLFLGGFLLYTDKKHPDQPSDNLDGEIIDAAGDYGFYSPWSWWPLVIGLTCAITVIGVAIAWWVFLLAIPLALAAIVGWVYEYNRGDHAH